MPMLVATVNLYLLMFYHILYVSQDIGFAESVFRYLNINDQLFQEATILYFCCFIVY